MRCLTALVRLPLLYGLILAGVCAHAAAPLETGLDPDWQLISDRNEIQVYMRHRDDSRLKTFRGVTRMKLPDEYAMSGLLNDYENIPKWLHFVDGATEIKRDGPLERYLRFTTHLPWPLTDREAILRADVVQTVTPDQETVAIELSNEPDLIPRNKEYVRFPEMQGVFKLRRLGEDMVEITYELVMDPGGYIPTWLANLLLRDAPYFTLERLRRIIVLPAYQGLFYDYLEIRGPGRPVGLAPPRSYIYGPAPESPIERATLGMVNPPIK